MNSNSIGFILWICYKIALLILIVIPLWFLSIYVYDYKMPPGAILLLFPVPMDKKWFYGWRLFVMIFINMIIMSAGWFLRLWLLGEPWDDLYPGIVFRNFEAVFFTVFLSLAVNMGMVKVFNSKVFGEYVRFM